MDLCKKACPRILFILIFAVSAAFLWKLFYVEKMPNWKEFVAGAAVYDDNHIRIDISLSSAENLFYGHQAVFIDARSPEQYRQGHVKGAINIPWNSVEESVSYVLENIDPNTTIITYCDGLKCSLSHNLAKFLIQLGYNDVKVLVNGWSSWIEHGLPVERG